MQNDLDPIQLILHASITVQLVMLTLIWLCVLSFLELSVLPGRDVQLPGASSLSVMSSPSFPNA